MSEIDAAVRAASERKLPRAELAAAIVARLETLGAPPESVAAARRIAEPKSVVIVAGQQPVLFGGPGLVWAKACDALALARAIEKAHLVPAVAVFWNASEDHDHAECDHVRMDLGSDVELLRVPLPNDRRMLSRVPVPPEARALLETLRAKFPQGPSRDDVLAALEPASDDTMGSWFSRILLRLLGREGLVVVEPQTMRQFARTVVEHEIARPGELAASIRRAESDAVAKGEPKALDLARDELFFLVDDAGRRVRVTREGDAWRAADGRALSTSQMRALPPEAFSWNVAARVLAQDVALPVAAQICGPSEIVYCARLAAAHEALGLPSPALVRRAEWTFETARTQRLQRDLGVRWSEIAERGAPAAAPPAFETPVAVQGLREIAALLPTDGSAAVQRRRAALLRDIDAYLEALKGDAAERDKVRADRMRRLLAAMLPDGEGQDRRISPLPWFAAEGLTRLYERPQPYDHRALTTVDAITRPRYRHSVWIPNRGATA